GGAASCTQNAPAVSFENEYQRGVPGSYGLPGQKLTYAVRVVNTDIGCGSSTFAVSLSAPDGFTVSMPTSTINLSSGSSDYVFANVTSPSGSPDGDYPLSATATKSGTATPATSGSSYYKVYSSDSAAPWFDWSNPWDG